MKPDEFYTLKTIITECEVLEQLVEKEIDALSVLEFPNVRDRLKDGENLISLYIECLDYKAYLEQTNRSKEADDAEESFWQEAYHVLVDHLNDEEL